MLQVKRLEHSQSQTFPNILRGSGAHSLTKSADIILDISAELEILDKTLVLGRVFEATVVGRRRAYRDFLKYPERSTHGGRRSSPSWAFRVVVTLVTSLLRLNSRKFVTLMATSETSSVW
jgi:hypothetical protein